jgi:DNA polymerase-4
VSANALCRDCGHVFLGDAEARCPICRSARVRAHGEVAALSIAHVDCDAFYATVEKRDDPSLADRPVIVGGGQRGVALTACYVARRFGVRSAMPMAQALRLCPRAVVIRPDMEKYSAVSRQVKAVLRDLTPVVEPVSLDEAYLDLTGVEAAHGRPPASILAIAARRIEREIGVSVSIGLSFNKLLAKIASDMDKPRGFGVIGRAESRGVLAAMPARALPGVGPKMAARLAERGVHSIADIQALSVARLRRLIGASAERLAALAEGRDARRVVGDREAVGVSAENTFARDLTDRAALEAELWPLCEKVSRRLKASEQCGRTVVLKLKTARFRLLTRRRALDQPTQLAERLYQTAKQLLHPEAGRTAYRLIGVGVTDIRPGVEADPPDLLDHEGVGRAVAVERAIDAVRQRFGNQAVLKGRGLRERNDLSAGPRRRPR